MAPSWQGFRATRWPLCTAVGMVAVDVDYSRDQISEKVDIVVHDSRLIPELTIALGGAGKRVAYRLADVSSVHLIHDQQPK